MHLLELAAQGVKGFSPTARAALTPGYNVVQAPGGEPVPLTGLTLALLYSDGRGEDAVYSVPGGPPGKAAVTLQGNDLTTYRVVRELGGVGGLHRLNKATGKFELVSKDAMEVTQFLRGQVGAPGKSTFEHLFMLSAAHFPSRKPKEQQGSGEKKLPGLAQAAPVAAASDIGEAERRLQDLERELQFSHEIDKLQFRQDGLASKMFELESKLKATEGLKAAVADARAAYDSAPTVESLNLSKDIVSRCERFGALAQRRDDALAKVYQDREAAEADTSSGVEPLYRDPRFLAGVAIGTIVLVAGIFLDGIGRYIALLDIPAFGFAALVALKWVDDVQGSQRSGRKGELLAVREKKIQDEFESEARYVRSAMSLLGVESAQDVIDILARKPLLAEKVSALEAQLAQAEADPEFATAAREFEALRRESDQINAQLQERSGGYVRDPREIEREIDRVRQSIELARSPQLAAPQEAPEAAASGVEFEDPTPMLASLAGDLLQQDVPGVAALVKDRCGQYLGALSDRRYLGIEIDHKGNGWVTAADKKVAVKDLPARDIDLYYLSLRLTLVEKCTARMKMPFLIEDTVGPIDDAKVPLVARMIKHLGTLTQIVHLTGVPAFAAGADSTVQL